VSDRRPKQLTLKLFAAEGDAIESDAFVAVFHRWIQDKRLAVTTVDVIDYAHVHHGPGVVLVTHPAHYATDGAGGRFGLQYAQKRDARGTLEERIVTAGRALYAAADALEAEPTLAGRLRYRRDELAISLVDRLETPNEPEVAAEVRPDVERAAATLLGLPVRVTRLEAPALAFTATRA